MASEKMTLAHLYRGVPKDARDGGWGRLREMISDGRKVAREEAVRWQENRAFYRGEQHVGYAADERMLRYGNANGSSLTNRSYNRLRQFTDARCTLLTKERPAFDVEPESRDATSMDAAKQAVKFIGARWGHTGWNIRGRLYELMLNGDIDGVSWLAVQWDPVAAGSRDVLVARSNESGEPITDRAEFEAMLAQDPFGEALWTAERSKQPMGEVSWRVILPGAISVDPFAVKDPREARWVCEQRVRPREEVERLMGVPWKDAVSGSTGRDVTRVQYEDVATDDGTARGGRVNEKSGVVVNYFWALPGDLFPKGARIEFADKAPDKPWVIEEYDEQSLPYFAFVPRPDPGHFIRSRGIVDDLKPVQRDFNDALADVNEWRKRLARTPVMIPQGSMLSDTFYSPDGYVEYFGGVGEPHYPQFPSEPSSVITNQLAWMTAEMERISGVSQLSQGFTAPGAPEAAVGINMQLQQTEQNLSETEANLTEAIEWGVARSLRLVEKFYDVARVVVGVGVDDAEEFNSFHGQMLRGSHRMRVTSPLMPKSKAARIAALTPMLPFLGDRIVPHIAALIEGDPTELQRDVEVDRQREKDDIRRLIGLVRDEKAQLVYRNFEEDKAKFGEAMNMAIQSGSRDPMGDLQRAGITPPNLTQLLLSAGFEVPQVEDFYDKFLGQKALDEFRKGDGYPRLHAMAKQLLRERADAYKQGMAGQVGAMSEQMPVGQQQGSAPKELGTPSPPKGGVMAPGGMPR